MSDELCQAAFLQRIDNAFSDAKEGASCLSSGVAVAKLHSVCERQVSNRLASIEDVNVI